jgi:hypothetical protein
MAVFTPYAGNAAGDTGLVAALSPSQQHGSVFDTALQAKKNLDRIADFDPGADTLVLDPAIRTAGRPADDRLQRLRRRPVSRAHGIG